MSYAGSRVIFDADSHLMEMADFLSKYADPEFSAHIPNLEDIEFGDVSSDMQTLDGSPGHDEATVAELVALGDNLTRGPKWHAALGSFGGGERGLALDLLGFRRQVIFSSFCARRVFTTESIAVRYATASAHNASMAEFCDADDRLLGVAMVPFDDVQAALRGIDEAIDLGLGAIWIASEAPGGRSPGHADHDPLWAKLEASGLPFVLHVGSSDLSIPDEWMNDGFSERESARGRAEVIGSKDLSVIFHSAQRFISTLVLDGVLEKFRGLRGGVIELGAGWVPDTIRRLDHAVDIWARTEKHLATFNRRPSEQFSDQLRFTPYPFEDVGRLIEESSPELYLFSSDYPHAEGGRDPIGRFERSLEGHSDATQDLFFRANAEVLYGASA